MDSAMQEPGQAVSSIPIPRGLVRVYAYYRFLLATLLLGMYLAGFATGILGTSSPPVFLTTAIASVALTVSSLLWLIIKRFNCERLFLFLNLLLDIVALNLLMFSSGGLSSGIGFLLVIAIATGSLIFTGQLSLFLAAFASILVIAGTTLSIILFNVSYISLFPTGLLGVLLFLTALLFRSLNRRLADSQSLATREADQAAHLQRLNELIMNRMRTGIILVDTSAQIKLINTAAMEHLGDPRPRAQLQSGFPLKALPKLYKQYERWHAYPWLRCPPITIDGSNTVIQCNFARLDENERRHTIIFIEDTRSAAQNAQQLKLESLGRLAGSIAHEIRNPLGAISHAAQLLAEQEKSPPAMKQLIDIIDRHSHRVNSIVDSILQLSRQQAPVFQKLQLGRWLKRFVKEYTDAHPGEGIIEIEETGAGGEQLQVLFDPVHLNQVLSNLVDNAFRYSQNETGEAWAKLSYHTEQSTRLPCLDVCDKGPGIDKQNIGQIFEPFFTTSNSGTGLGLYLAKERCEFNYGTLSYRIDNNSHEANNLKNDLKNKGFFRLIFAHPDQLLPEQADDQSDSINR
ncbi:MAG: histidine kinase [Gammaproteobacteria bacterium]|nr:MAG: histidine kinase [Gammaproteobacteria bacterium]